MVTLTIAHIVSDPAKHGGKPYIAGKGVTVQHIAALSNLGWTVQDLTERIRTNRWSGLRGPVVLRRSQGGDKSGDARCDGQGAGNRHLPRGMAAPDWGPQGRPISHTVLQAEQRVEQEGRHWVMSSRTLSQPGSFRCPFCPLSLARERVGTGPTPLHLPKFAAAKQRRKQLLDLRIAQPFQLRQQLLYDLRFGLACLTLRDDQRHFCHSRGL